MEGIFLNNLSLGDFQPTQTGMVNPGIALDVYIPGCSCLHPAIAPIGSVGILNDAVSVKNLPIYIPRAKSFYFLQAIEGKSISIAASSKATTVIQPSPITSTCFVTKTSRSCW